MDLGAFAGAGAIRSAAGDMFTYLEAQLHPGRAPALRKAIELSQQLREPALPGMHIAFAWLPMDADGTYWHNGGTFGYSAYVFFNPQGDYAGVLLVNTAVPPNGDSLADRIGLHVAQRLASKPMYDL
jgi:CubicO group peptidase (beta-lactamase class C family)